jgi:hypothetical protein
MTAQQADAKILVCNVGRGTKVHIAWSPGTACSVDGNRRPTRGRDYRAGTLAEVTCDRCRRMTHLATFVTTPLEVEMLSFHEADRPDVIRTVLDVMTTGNDSTLRLLGPYVRELDELYERDELALTRAQAAAVEAAAWCVDLLDDETWGAPDQRQRLYAKAVATYADSIRCCGDDALFCDWVAEQHNALAEWQAADAKMGDPNP